MKIMIIFRHIIYIASVKKQFGDFGSVSYALTEFFPIVHNIQEKEELHLVDKLRINSVKQKMKVGFAAQIFCKRVVDALTVFKNMDIP